MVPAQSPIGDNDCTQWSTIIQARDGTEAVRRQAMERLLVRYYTPISRYVQAALPPSKRSPDFVKDLTQEFIAHCLRVDFLKNVDPSNGRFRSFIRGCINHFLIEEYRWSTAQKRDSRKEAYSLDESRMDGESSGEPEGISIPPEKILDREWALSLLEKAMDSLENECRQARRSAVFNALRGNLAGGGGEVAMITAATQLGMSEGTVRVALHRLRTRLGELIGEEVRQTLGPGEDWREELRYLISLLSGD